MEAEIEQQSCGLQPVVRGGVGVVAVHDGDDVSDDGSAVLAFLGALDAAGGSAALWPVCSVGRVRTACIGRAVLLSGNCLAERVGLWVWVGSWGLCLSALVCRRIVSVVVALNRMF